VGEAGRTVRVRVHVRGVAGWDVQVRCDVSFAVESIKTETHYDVQVR